VKQTNDEGSETGSLVNGNEVGRRQMIETKLREIVENINDNRKQHTDTIEKFKKEIENKACNDATFRNDYRGSEASGFIVGLWRLMGVLKPCMGIWLFVKYDVQICRLLCILTAISLLTD